MIKPSTLQQSHSLQYNDENIYIAVIKSQGKSEGFDSCNQPSNLWWITSKIIGHLFYITSSFEKQQGTSSMLLQVLCIIS